MPCTPGPHRWRDAGAISDVAVTIRHNQAHNGIEVVFASKPAEAIRSALKALGFRWSQRQGLWYARHTPRTWEQVHALLGEAETPEPESEPDLPEQEAPAETEVPHYVIEEPLTGQIIGGNGDDPDRPEPEPWQMTRLAYQKSKAATSPAAFQSSMPRTAGTTKRLFARPWTPACPSRPKSWPSTAC